MLEVVGIQDWIDAALRALDILAWPLVVVVALVMLRGHLPSVGKWFQGVIANRGVTASTPIGTFKVDPPGIEQLVQADETAARIVYEQAPDDQRLTIRPALEALEALERAQDQADAVWGSGPLSTTDARARRIAERAKVLLGSLPDADKSSGIRFAIAEGRGADYREVERLGSFTGPPTSKALLLLAFFRPWSIGLEDATYMDYIRAAQLLRDEGADVPVPPFEMQHLNWARSATNIS